MEQARDPIKLQFKSKVQNEEYSKEILQQGIRYKHYLNKLDHIVLKDEVITMQYYDEVVRSNIIKYYFLNTCKMNYYSLYMERYTNTLAYTKSKMLQEIPSKILLPRG